MNEQTLTKEQKEDYSNDMTSIRRDLGGENGPVLQILSEFLLTEVLAEIQPYVGTSPFSVEDVDNLLAP